MKCSRGGIEHVDAGATDPHRLGLDRKHGPSLDRGDADPEQGPVQIDGDPITLSNPCAGMLRLGCVAESRGRREDPPPASDRCPRRADRCRRGCVTRRRHTDAASTAGPLRTIVAMPASPRASTSSPVSESSARVAPTRSRFGRRASTSVLGQRPGSPSIFEGLAENPDRKRDSPRREEGERDGVAEPSRSQEDGVAQPVECESCRKERGRWPRASPAALTPGSSAPLTSVMPKMISPTTACPRLTTRTIPPRRIPSAEKAAAGREQDQHEPGQASLIEIDVEPEAADDEVEDGADHREEEREIRRGRKRAR